MVLPFYESSMESLKLPKIMFQVFHNKVYLFCSFWMMKCCLWKISSFSGSINSCLNFSFSRKVHSSCYLVNFVLDSYLTSIAKIFYLKIKLTLPVSFDLSHGKFCIHQFFVYPFFILLYLFLSSQGLAQP